VAETEDVAMDITNELARNREKIESSREKVRTIYYSVLVLYGLFGLDRLE
jgi:hypothetical protein